MQTAPSGDKLDSQRDADTCTHAS